MYLSLDFVSYSLYSLIVVCVLLALYLGFYYKVVRPRKLRKRMTTAPFSLLSDWAYFASIDRGSRFPGLYCIHLPALIIAVGAWVSMGYAWVSLEVGLGIILGCLCVSGVYASYMKKKTLRVISELFVILSNYIHFDSSAQLRPWKVIKVKSFLPQGLPAKIQVSIPANFNTAQSMWEKLTDLELHVTNRILGETDYIYNFTWKPRQCDIEAVKDLPTYVEFPESFPESANISPWVIPLGIQRDGNIATWDTKEQPQALFVGATGSGKSTTQELLLCHLLSIYPEYWRFYGVDLKMVQLSRYTHYPSCVGVATTLEDAYEVIHEVYTEMMDRFARMKDAGVIHVKDIDPDTPGIFLMIDESAQLLEPHEQATSPELKEENAIKAACRKDIISITQLGRAARVHMCIATQRANVNAIGGGNVKNNCQFRIALGSMDATASTMILDSTSAKRTRPETKGRGIIARDVGNESMFQSYILRPGMLQTDQEVGMGAGGSVITDDFSVLSGDSQLSNDTPEAMTLGDALGLSNNFFSQGTTQDNSNNSNNSNNNLFANWNK